MSGKTGSERQAVKAALLPFQRSPSLAEMRFTRPVCPAFRYREQKRLNIPVTRDDYLRNRLQFSRAFAPPMKGWRNRSGGGGLTMQTISNDPPPTGTRCDICGRQLTTPWVKSGPYRMHLSCRDAINDDLERKVVEQKNPKSANDD